MGHDACNTDTPMAQRLLLKNVGQMDKLGQAVSLWFPFQMGSLVLCGPRAVLNDSKWNVKRFDLETSLACCLKF